MEYPDLNIDTLWFEVAIVCAITSFGNIFLGHFEIHTSKTKKVFKLLLFIIITVCLSQWLNRTVAFSFLGLTLMGVLFIHMVWLPKKGINGWTGEPKEKYYKLRGWEKYLK